MRALPYTLVFFACLAIAQEPPPPPDLEPVPDGSPTGSPEEAPEVPEVTIRRRPGTTIQEYRINGRLYMVRIIPTRGVPYYLLDVDGDGNLETRYNDLDPRIMIPGWVLFSW